MSKEAIKNLLMDFLADYDPNKWSNDDVYEKYAEKIDNVRSMGEIIAVTELTKKVKDLEVKLAESEKDRLMWQEMYKSADKQNKEICETDIYPLQEQVQQLKQQLAEKDAEVQSWKDGTMVVKLGKLEEQLAEKEKFLERIMSGEYIPANIAEKSLKLSNQTAIAVLEEMLENEIYLNVIPDFECGDYVSSKIIKTKIEELKNGRN